MNGPTRTCIGCRQPSPAAALVRLMVLDGRVAVAVRPRGRGAWLHPTAECSAAAVKTKAFARAFKAQVKVPQNDELIAALTAAWTSAR